MKYKEVKEETRINFKKIFECSEHFNDKKRDISKDEEKISLMLSAFGKGKLSVNRHLRTGDPVLLYIYKLDKNFMFKSFWNEYKNKITDKTRIIFLDNYFKTKFIVEACCIFESDFQNIQLMELQIEEFFSIIRIFNRTIKKEENRITNEKISRFINLDDMNIIDEDLGFLGIMITNPYEFKKFIKTAYSNYEKSKIINIEELKNITNNKRRL